MYLEKILRKQEQKRQRAERELLQLEKEQERWSKQWQYEKEKRSQLYGRYYEEARRRTKKEGIPSDPKGNLRTILKETYRVNISYLDGIYHISDMVRFFIPVITLGISVLIMYILAGIFGVTLLKTTRLVIVAIALIIAVIAYLVGPLIIEFFGIRRKIRTAAECKAGYDLIEESEPLDD
jgi:hypothetical protein